MLSWLPLAGQRWANARVGWARLRWRANQLAAWERRRAVQPQVAARPPVPFVVGIPRSGTTLLRMMLDAHPDLAVPPETGFITAANCLGHRTRRQFLESVVRTPGWADFHLDAATLAASLDGIEPFTVADGLRRFYGLYAVRCGKPRFADKTPAYHDRMPLIVALLPEARFVHIIRDGRDVALSWRKTWFAPSADIAVLARLWQHGVRAARGDARRVPYYLEVRFEDLVEHPERELRKICTFAELPFADAMLRYHEGAAHRIAEHEARVDRRGTVLAAKDTRMRRKQQVGERPDLSRIAAWRAEMTPAEQARFESAAGTLLADLGYDTPRGGA